MWEAANVPVSVEHGTALVQLQIRLRIQQLKPEKYDVH
jgi:hypothetical protein